MTIARDSKGRFVSSGGSNKIRPKYSGASGMREFGEDFRKWASEFVGANGALARKLKQCAVTVTKEAKQRAPVDIGTLKHSIQYHGPEISGGKLSASVGTDEEHGIYVEFAPRLIKAGSAENPREDWPAKRETGTASRETMPYLRAAFYAKRAEVLRILAEIRRG